MTRRRPSFRLLALMLTFGVAALPSPVFASGFQLVEQNGSGLGNAYAGQAAGVKDASAILFNPAALTRTKGWSFVAAAAGIGLSTTFTDSGSTVPSVPFPPPVNIYNFPVPLGNSGGDAGKWKAVPSGYLSGQVTERIWLGFGVNVPFGLETDWDPAWMGRYHATKSSVEARTYSPAIALQLSDTLSVGGGASYQDFDADFNSGVAFGGLSFAGTAQATAAYPAPVRAAALAAVTYQLGPEGQSLEGAGLIHGTSHAWGWNAGALLKLGEQAHLGVSYRSKVTHDIEGDVTFQGAPSFALPGALAPIGDALNARFANGPVETKITLPETWSVAAAWEGAKAEVLADWTWTGWDVLQSLDINRADGSPLSSVPLNFQNTWRVGLGFNYKMSPAWKLRLGTAYDKSPVQDQYRTPRLPDSNRVWAAGGFEWTITQKARVDLGYAHIFIDKGTSDLPNQETATAPPLGALVGEYSAKTDIVGAQLTLSF
jgi:long-chain fatty acid transport protein